MTEKDNLLKKIKMYDFVVDETALFLDTHPNCREALDHFHKYRKLLKDATDEYETKFGPITIHGVLSEDYWTWVDEPWPWEIASSENMGKRY